MVGGGIMTCDSDAIGEYCADFSNARARLLLKVGTTNVTAVMILLQISYRYVKKVEG